MLVAVKPIFFVCEEAKALMCSTIGTKARKGFDKKVLLFLFLGFGF